MFEEHEKDVESLMHSNSAFRALYYKHRELDSKVHDAEIGVLPMDDVTLHNLKKEKLWAKEKLLQMWEANASSSSTA
jgi:uncharacterized protein